MPQTVELPDDLADALFGEASRLGMSLPEFAVSLLWSARPSGVPVGSGAELVAYWQAEGLAGSRPDIADSQMQARNLRDQAQRRGT